VEGVCVSSLAWHRALQSVWHVSLDGDLSSISHEEVLAEQCRTIGSLGNNFVGEAMRTAAELILLHCAVLILRAREDFAL